MIEFKQITDKKIWEEFNAKQPLTSPFQSWNWMEFEKALGQDVETIGIYKDNLLCGLIPICKVKAKRGRYLWLRRGPIFDFSDREIWKFFFTFISQKAKREGYWFVRLSPLILKAETRKYSDVLSKLKECPMHDIDAEIALVIDLRRSEEEILNNMRKNTRYYVRKAERDGVKIIRTQDLGYFERFWHIYSDTVNRHKWTAYSKEYIRKELEIFTKDDAAEMFLAEYKGELVAGSIFLYYQNQAVYHHSGSLSAYAKVSASYLIQWEAIKTAKKRGLSYYNFWGVSPLVEIDGQLQPKKGHPWEGLSFFKLGFGGQVQEFIHAKDLPVSVRYHLINIFEKIERKRRGY